MATKDYPETVVEVLDNDASYAGDVVEAVRTFAEAAPWKGSLKSRKGKFLRLNGDLARACGIDEPTLAFRHLDGSSSGASYYTPRDHRIVIVGKLSVVTFLHEFGHAQGFDEKAACRWSINLFRKCFPRQYSRLVHVGHMLIRPEAVAQRISCRTGARATRSATLDAASREPVARQG